MKLKDLIGKTVSEVTDRWDGECDEDEIRLKFEDGTQLRVMAIDYSEPGCGGSLGINTEIE